ncbi:MAG: type I-E CRISPR-associated protein Cse1/CasA [Rhodocyclaceae bacterium]
MTDLLKADWIPVRPFDSTIPTRISVRELLCGSRRWQPHLPRDDMEFGLIQMLTAFAQVLFPPQDKPEWAARVTSLPDTCKFAERVDRMPDWFQLDHPQHPFMQVAKVAAKEHTDMDKLLPGLTGNTSACFVNERGLAAALCGGCAAIALFNQATQAPGFGGGFKQGLKGVGVSTLLQGDDLRQTVWLNVLTEESLDASGIAWRDHIDQAPTWVTPIEAGATVSSGGIGLLRGLFWQPLHVRLRPPTEGGICSCCGQPAASRYTAFDKAKFSFTVEGVWPHPHAPRTVTLKKGLREERFVAITTDAPAWTQLDRYITRRVHGAMGEDLREPAAVVEQARAYLLGSADKLLLLAGGYRCNQASIVERRHSLFTVNRNWHAHTDVIHRLVDIGQGYRKSLRSVLYQASTGIDKIRNERQARVKTASRFKGVGLDLHERAEKMFYRRSTPMIGKTLALVDFESPGEQFAALRVELQALCSALFTEVTAPYQHDLDMQQTIALTRRMLAKRLRELETLNWPSPQEAA